MKRAGIITGFDFASLHVYVQTATRQVAVPVTALAITMLRRGMRVSL